MTGGKSLVILLLVIFTLTLVGCDVFKDDTLNTKKTAAVLSVTEVKDLEELYVDPGTEETDVIDKLKRERNKTDLVLSDNSEVVGEIAWGGANGNFNSEKLGSYEFEGTVRHNDWSTDISIVVVIDNKYSLILEIKGEGEVEILDEENNVILSTSDNKKEIRYEPGSTLQLTAVSPNNGLFMGWKGEKNTKQPTVEITMDENKELEAVFGNILVFDVETNFSDWYIKGKLENLIGSKIESVEIHVELYNGEDEQINTNPILDVKKDIAEGEIVEWGARLFVKPENNSYYKIILKNIQLEE